MKCHYCSKKFLGNGVCLEHNDGSTIDYCSHKCLEKKFKGYALGCIEDDEDNLKDNIKKKVINPLSKRFLTTRIIFFRACLNDTITEDLKKLKALADDAMTDMLERLNEEVQAGNETEEEYLYTADFLKNRSLFMNLIIKVLGK